MKINLVLGTSDEHVYEVNDNKIIRIRFQRETHEIKDVSLVSINKNGYDMKCDSYKADGLLYLENVCHGEENEILNTNLLILAEGMFKEVC